MGTFFREYFINPLLNSSLFPPIPSQCTLPPHLNHHHFLNIKGLISGKKTLLIGEFLPYVKKGYVWEMYQNFVRRKYI